MPEMKRHRYKSRYTKGSNESRSLLLSLIDQSLSRLIRRYMRSKLSCTKMNMRISNPQVSKPQTSQLELPRQAVGSPLPRVQFELAGIDVRPLVSELEVLRDAALVDPAPIEARARLGSTSRRTPTGWSHLCPSSEGNTCREGAGFSTDRGIPTVQSKPCSSCNFIHSPCPSGPVCFLLRISPKDARLQAQLSFMRLLNKLWDPHCPE